MSSSANPIPSASKPAEFLVACPHCSVEMPANAALCPACGWSMKPLAAADRGLARYAYLTLIPAAALLLLPAYRQRRFIRFHAWQSLLIWGVFLVLTAVAVLFFECGCGDAVTSGGRSRVAGDVLSVGRSLNQGLARRTLRAAVVWRIGGTAVLRSNVK